MEKTVHSLAELEQAAADLVKTLAQKQVGATLVTLSGELGAGKTAFVKAAARTLGVKDDITSPTFVILKAYDLENRNFKRLIHIDAYRLEDGKELTPLRFDELTGQADNLIMLEWPEKVSGALPAPDVRIGIEALPDGSRKITYA